MMKRLSSLLLLCLTIGYMKAQENVLANIVVSSGNFDRLHTPVYADLSRFANLQGTADLVVYEVVDGENKLISSQVEPGPPDLIWWMLEGYTPAHQERHFSIARTNEPSSEDQLSIMMDGKYLVVQDGAKERLGYAYQPVDMPAGISGVYSRAGFIHPLRAPSGEVLTRIQPPDHYHHYGIWNPWTHTEYKGKSIDFWNLNKEEGTVEVDGKPETSAGPLFADLNTVHRHMVKAVDAQSSDEVALRESWKIRVWKGPADSLYLVDVVSQLNCAQEAPFVIKAYRYQGFGFRANAAWDDSNVSLFTSEGLDKSNGNATRARWCDVTGPAGANGEAGVTFFTHPFNYNYPEQLRIWPVGANKGTENVFFNFNPAQDRDWILEPNQTYSLRYRMLVHDGQVDSLTAEHFWSDFAHPPRVQIVPHTPLQGKRVLVYTRNGEGYVHDNIPTTVKALQKLGEENGFAVEASDDPTLFNPRNLARYDALIFSNTNISIFDTDLQKEALQEYIRKGGGFVGIHIASGSERSWPWFAAMIGGRFMRHPKHQTFTVEVLDHKHPSTYFMPHHWETADECYYLTHLNPDMHVLLAADLNTVEDEKMDQYPGNTFGSRFPLAWCHTYDGGRQWYTALGHDASHYENPFFMRHILGGIQWVLQKD